MSEKKISYLHVHVDGGLITQGGLLSEERAKIAKARLDYEAGKLPPPGKEMVTMRRSQVKSWADYLSALSANMLRNDADMMLEECRDPADVASEMLAAAAEEIEKCES